MPRSPSPGFLTLGVLLLTTFATSAFAKREYWAYPDGVIVTSKSSASKVPAIVKTQLDLAVKSLEPEFYQCVASLRERRPDLANARFVVTVELRFDENGIPGTVELERRPAREIVECAARAMVRAQSFRLAPQAKPRAIDARLTLEGVILSDDDAKGRGYLYYESKQKNPEKTAP